MKSLRTSILFVILLIISLSFVPATIANTNTSATTNTIMDSRYAWMKSFLETQNESINTTDCIFYFVAGCYGITWALITSDSLGYHIYNGTTIHNSDSTHDYNFDTLSFLKNNAKTIIWGLDSLAAESQSLSAYIDTTYNPLYQELYLVRNRKIIFSRNKAKHFIGRDSVRFNSKFSKLLHVMLWIASSSGRHYLYTPNDTSFLE